MTADDEDVLRIPVEWHPHIDPRRDGRSLPALTPVPKAAAKAAKLVADAATTLETVLAGPTADGDCVAAARDQLAGIATPLGAAVVAGVVTTTLADARLGGLAVFADAWASSHGIVFAAEAVAELADLTVSAGIPKQSGSARSAETTGPGMDTQAPPLGPRPRSAGEQHPARWPAEPVARRVRALLAHADEADYVAAGIALAARRRGEFQRTVTAFLLPTEQSWLGAGAAGSGSRGITAVDSLLARTTRSAADGSRLLTALAADRNASTEQWWSLLCTAADGLDDYTVLIGLATTLLHGRPLGDGRVPAVPAARDVAAAILAALPADAAFTALTHTSEEEWDVGAAVATAVRRFPRRGLRLLAGVQASASTAAGRLSRNLAAANPALAAEVLSTLSGAAADRLATTIQANNRYRVAADDAVPTPLTVVPWTRTTPASPVPAIFDLPVPPTEPPSAHWLPGEQHAWARHRAAEAYHDWDEAFADWASVADAHRRGALSDSKSVRLFAEGPATLVGPMLAEWHPDYSWDIGRHARRLAGRHGVAVLPTLRRMAAEQPLTCAVSLLPFRDAAVAELMAELFSRSATVRTVASAWLARHGVHAARLLLPAALGGDGRGRTRARAALRVAADGHEEAVTADAARLYGEAAGEVVARLTAVDPLDTDPMSGRAARQPVVGDWADPVLLPPILLSDGRHTLPRTAILTLLTVLATRGMRRSHPLLVAIRASCDTASLGEFVWRLHQIKEKTDRRERTGWEQRAGADVSDWAVTALGLLGDDETARRIAGIISGRARVVGAARNVAVVRALAEIGTDAALTHLQRVDRRDRTERQQDQARLWLTIEAGRRGLGLAQLAQRTVPRLGFGPDGRQTVDYGRRRFSVSIDDGLQLVVTDETGAVRKTLPAVLASDDHERAQAGQDRIRVLRAELRAVVDDQVRRLTDEMTRPVPQPVALFREGLHHPVLWPVSRGLVWLAVEPGRKPVAFRVAEDRTFADVDDDELAVTDAATVSPAHPARLGAGLDRWAKTFSEYEILQPFPQLGRPVPALTDDERGASELARFHGLVLTGAALRRLTHPSHAWQKAGLRPDGSYRALIRETGDRTVVVELDVSPAGRRRIHRIRLHDEPGGGWGDRQAGRPFGDLDSATAAEVIADLTTLTEAGQIA
ncbi:hypothetical protein FHR81_001947 [Actinoalloteichus hoggarensis]|uniref:DUF4132 domain-containing protein n=1 Tax=Actinoalloteichus hoggarensis TaxID=1470176 RepID=A0A221W538_9PSEU|nr:DUF4132 domain-containing protein [Actinoalloteichus hoggarensis]ASO20978.1 hypothetical protein AHOG_16760 [Actinoalloteichus hoggarensis]MBB5920909.1 hypothetical protein [Actinoalloteichus hoggarensis]